MNKAKSEQWQVLKVALFIVGISLPTCQQISKSGNFINYHQNITNLL
jgi:hypothetical protein